MTPKQLKALEKVEYFMLPNTRFRIPGIEVQRSVKGVSAEEAFFMKTERGILPPKVKNPVRLYKLISAHNWMTTHEKMWREGFEENTLYPADFEGEPSYIQEMAKKCCEAAGRTWYL